MKYNIVIVDDEQEINAGLTKFIPSVNDSFNVAASFTDAPEAFKFISENDIHILITDINMPSVNGINLIEQIRAINKSVHIIIISGHRDFEYALAAIKLNVHSFITKPIDLDELTNVLISVKLELDRDTKDFNEANSYIINKTLIDIYNNMISPSQAENVLSHISAELTSCCFTTLSINFIDLSKHIESEWCYGKDKFYNAVTNVISGTNSFSSNSIFGFYFLSASKETLKYVYIGEAVTDEQLQNISALISENLVPVSEITIEAAAQGIISFCNLFNEKKTALTDISDEDFIISKAKAFINKNYNRDISLYDVASHVRLNHVYFSKFFKNCTGINFIDYIVELRINKAVELLKTQKYTGIEISEMVGYQSYSYFLRLFKSHIGCSPKEFARRLIADENE